MLKYEDLTQKDLKRLSESNFSKITHETSNLYASPNPIPNLKLISKFSYKKYL